MPILFKLNRKISSGTKNNLTYCVESNWIILFTKIGYFGQKYSIWQHLFMQIRLDHLDWQIILKDPKKRLMLENVDFSSWTSVELTPISHTLSSNGFNINWAHPKNRFSVHDD